MKFRELFENVKEKQFTLKLNGVETIAVRHFHVRSPRENSNIPRDSGMSKSKYQKVLELGIPNIDINKAFTITWTSKGKNNAISAEFLSDGKLSVFSALMKQEKDHSKLFAAYTNRYHIGELN